MSSVDVVNYAAIRQWRELRGIRQDGLGEAIGVSGPTISKMESGQVAVDIRHIPKLAARLRCEPAQLLNLHVLGLQAQAATAIPCLHLELIRNTKIDGLGRVMKEWQGERIAVDAAHAHCMAWRHTSGTTLIIDHHLTAPEDGKVSMIRVSGRDVRVMRWLGTPSRHARWEITEYDALAADSDEERARTIFNGEATVEIVGRVVQVMRAP